MHGKGQHVFLAGHGEDGAAHQRTLLQIEDAIDLVGDALAQVGLQGREDHTPGELSGGQQQRVAIARAIVASPTLLVADEPTGNLDTARSHEIMELLTGLNRDHGLTIVMVTHESDIAAFADRTIGFLDGNIGYDRVNTEPAHVC